MRNDEAVRRPSGPKPGCAGHREVEEAQEKLSVGDVRSRDFPWSAIHTGSQRKGGPK